LGFDFDFVVAVVVVVGVVEVAGIGLELVESSRRTRCYPRKLRGYPEFQRGAKEGH
jgi:hypothetical protein